MGNGRACARGRAMWLATPCRSKDNPCLLTATDSFDDCKRAEQAGDVDTQRWLRLKAARLPIRRRSAAVASMQPDAALAPFALAREMVHPPHAFQREHLTAGSYGDGGVAGVAAPPCFNAPTARRPGGPLLLRTPVGRVR